MNDSNMLLGMNQTMLHSQWNTPKDIIERARFVMGSIDCDAATNLEAQTVVKAKVYYDGSLGRNGLLKPWFNPDEGIKNIWLNPPYGRLTNEFCYRSLILWEKFADLDCQMIVLIRGDGEGLKQLLIHCDRWVQMKRIKFEPGSQLKLKLEQEARKQGKKWINSPVPGSVLIYFGGRRELFSHKFKDYGLSFDRALQL